MSHPEMARASGAGGTVGGSGLRGGYVHPHLRGGHGRLRHRLLVFFGLGFAAILGLGALGSIAGAPSSAPLCQPSHPCGGPPSTGRPLVNQTVWRSSQFGFSLEYPGDEATVSGHDAASITLQVDLGNGNAGTILVQGSAASVRPAQAIANQITNLTGVTQLAPDTAAADQLLGSGVGYVPGAGSVHVGYFSSPQGVGQPVNLASEAASHGRATVSVTVGGPAGQTGPSSSLYQMADQIINSVHWSGRP
jgi:hypothetical protein